MSLGTAEHVPAIRQRVVNSAPVSPDGSYVLYWMIANRRTTWNFSLQRAVEWCKEFNRPLVILEAIQSDYQWNCDRFHQFVIEGMMDNAEACRNTPVTYVPYIEPETGHGRGLLLHLAQLACVVVTDDFPCFFLPRIVKAAAHKLPVRLEVVDSNGILPMHSTDRVFTVAHSFRRHLQKELRPHLSEFPQAKPLAGMRKIDAQAIEQLDLGQWRPAKLDDWRDDTTMLSDLPISHAVPPTGEQGGAAAAQRRLKSFIGKRLADYESHRNDPDVDAASGLSPYLHFGHISAHQIVADLLQAESWSRDDIAEKPNGKRDGWWGASSDAEAFLDELITWRELGYNLCSHTDDYDQYESLPDWALKTLEKHRRDSREFVYDLAEFEKAETHDPIWNAAQTQLVQEGRIHNYLRMLWGKKILHWTEDPRDALAIMIELNNKYALDGRNPNSYSGIFWVLGRYDRAWGPERPIFGKVRYMTSDSTSRKVRLDDYLERYGEGLRS